MYDSFPILRRYFPTGAVIPARLPINLCVDLLKVSRPTVSAYIARGDLKAIKTGGRIHITPESMEAYLARGVA